MQDITDTGTVIAQHKCLYYTLVYEQYEFSKPESSHYSYASAVVIRDSLGLPNEVWLRVYVVNRQIFAEPVIRKTNRTQYMLRLLRVTGDWFDAQELEENKEQVEKQISNRSL